MTQESTGEKSQHLYPTMIAVAGIGLWLAAVVSFFVGHGWQEQLTVMGLLPLVIITGMFPNTIPLPSGLRLSRERMNFTLSDALILLLACRYGFAACVFVAGIEGLTSSRRAIRRLSSNLYSFGMMSLAAAAATASLHAVLRYGFSETAGNQHTFPAIAVGVLVASVVHISVNTGIISVLFATRLGVSVMSSWKDNFRLAAPMFLPTSAAASLMYIGLQYNALTTVAIGAPLLIAIYFGHRRYRDSMQEQVNLIERAQQERIALLEKTHRETIEALAVTINAKDEVTHEHVLRVQLYAAGVARLLGCSDAEIEALKAGALLHDIGKIAVPDYIISKPGKLTAAEFEKMKTHTLVGAQILGRVGFPYPVVPVVRSHHERWDGKGYPDGLAGEEIPLTARILTVVDCFDAVREDRQYRKGMTRDEAIEYIMSNSGTQYDPRVVGTFITHLPEFEAEIIAHRNLPTPTFGIEPVEQLSAAACLVAPAAGLAEANAPHQQSGDLVFSDKQQTIISALARALSEASGLDEIIAAFMQNLKLLVPYDSCMVTLVAPHAEENVVAYTDGLHAELLSNRRIVPGEGVTGWALANRQPFYNADPTLDLPATLAPLSSTYRTLAACPVTHGNELHAVVTLYSATLKTYGEDHAQILREITGRLGIALSAQALHAQAATKLRSQEFTPALPEQTLSGVPAISLSLVVLGSELAH